MTTSYHSEGAYGPFSRRQHRGRHLVEIVTVAGLVGILASIVLIVAVRFKPPAYTACTARDAIVLCVTAPTPPTLPIPATFHKPGI